MGRRRRRRDKKKRGQQRDAIPFEVIVEAVRSGDAFPVIAPGDAVDVILDDSGGSLDTEAGESLSWHRRIIVLLMYAYIGSVLLGCVAAVMAFGWWALLTIPVVLLTSWIMGVRSNATTSFLVPLVLFLASVVAGSLLWESSRWTAVFAVSVPVPWLTQRIAGGLALRTTTRLMFDKPGVLAMLLARGDVFLVGKAFPLDDPSNE